MKPSSDHDTPGLSAVFNTYSDIVCIWDLYTWAISQHTAVNAKQSVHHSHSLNTCKRSNHNNILLYFLISSLANITQPELQIYSGFTKIIVQVLQHYPGDIFIKVSKKTNKISMGI